MALLADTIKTYDLRQLKDLAAHLREEVFNAVRENGGHFASNFGAVELTLALYKTFSFPKDKLLFDVGHQSYTHKLLTGRTLELLRKKGGVSGFPDPAESEYDAFVAGHSGNAIAAALGLCAARDLRGENYKVVCFVGDASLANGENLEAIFASEQKPKNLVVVLNDNGMAIDKSDSALYRSLSKATVRRCYRKFNAFLDKKFRTTSEFGRKLRRFKYSVKGWLNKNYFFERCGFKYVGPVDGHDLEELVGVLNDVQKIEDPVFLHAVTVKGKGYADAESDPVRFHGVGKNFAETDHSFSVALGRLLCSRAQEDASLVAITAAMTDGVGLSEFSQKFPDRFFDAGICEEAAVTMAAGMAKGGLSPVMCLYSTFLQRAFDQIVHDVCLQNLPVVFCIDRAGFVGADGKTHQGLLDVPILRAIPGLRLYAPKDCAELADVFDFARSQGVPAAIRYPNGYAPNLGSKKKISEYYLWETLIEGDGVVVLACGARAVARAVEAKKLCGVPNVQIVNCRSVSPLDTRLLDNFANRKIITFEEGYANGGFGSAVAEYYAQNNVSMRMKIIGAPSVFVPHATADEQAQSFKLTSVDLARKIQAFDAQQ